MDTIFILRPLSSRVTSRKRIKFAGETFEDQTIAERSPPEDVQRLLALSEAELNEGDAL